MNNKIVNVHPIVDAIGYDDVDELYSAIQNIKYDDQICDALQFGYEWHIVLSKDVYTILNNKGYLIAMFKGLMLWLKNPDDFI